MEPNEQERRTACQLINGSPATRESLEAVYGDVWDANQLREQFEVLGFLAPLVIVHRKTDGVKGTVLFQHSPRFYFQFRPSDGD
jgi:hypothetical protein